MFIVDPAFPHHVMKACQRVLGWLMTRYQITTPKTPGHLIIVGYKQETINSWFIRHFTNEQPKNKVNKTRNK
jgi:hypothetical protein